MVTNPVSLQTSLDTLLATWGLSLIMQQAFRSSSARGK